MSAKAWLQQLASESANSNSDRAIYILYRKLRELIEDVRRP
jgi:hypothetical protein